MIAIGEVEMMPILGSPEDEGLKRAIYGDEEMPTAAQDLAHYLAGEFRRGAPYQVAGRRDDSTGRCIADREVSRLEVLSAARRLRYRQRRVIELIFVDNVDPGKAARLLGISLRTLYDDRREAISQMATMIYEWEGN